MQVSFNRFSGSVYGAMVAMTLTAATASAQPNIEVRIDDAVIGNFFQHTFPAANIGDSLPQVVVVRNVGAQDLLFTQNPPIFLDGAFPGEFELVQPPLETGNKLSPNGSTAFLVRFKPVTPFANPSSFVRIATNDPDTPIFSLGVQGTTRIADLAVLNGGAELSPGSQLTFAPTEVGASSLNTLGIANVGDAPLTILATPQLAGAGTTSFQIAGLDVTTIAPGDAVDLQVSFVPQQAGVLSAQLTIVTDASTLAGGVFTLNLVGTGVAAPVNNDDETPPADEETPVDGDGADEDYGNDEAPVDGDADEQAGDEVGDEYGDVAYGDDADADNGAADDAEEYGDELVEEVVRNNRFVPPCGFGLGFAPLACMALMMGARRVR